MLLQHFEPTPDLPDEPKKALEELFELVTINLLKYHRSSGFAEHGFYSEQQIKTYFTGALLELSAGYAIQEYRVNRVYFDDESSQNYTSNGAIDYWALINNNSYIFECKSYWTRYYPQRDKNYLTQYKETIYRLNQGFSQMESIGGKLNHRAGDELWGASICAAPFYAEVNSLSEYLEPKRPQFEFFKEAISDSLSAHKGISWYFAEFCPPYLKEFSKNSSDKKIIYPGILYLAKVKRLRRN